MAYITVAQVKRYLDITGDGDDPLFDLLIDAAQAHIETYTGRKFAATANTTRTFDSVADVTGRTLWLDHDLASINSITNGDGTTVTSSQYTTAPRNETPYHQIKLLASANIRWEANSTTDDSEDAISISGKWAYSAAAPADIQQATIVLASYMYRQKDAQVFDTTAIPDAGVIQIPQGIPATVTRMIAKYRKVL